MAFRVLHTADWQIGKPFRAFGDRLGGLLEEARFDAIDQIAVAARASGAQHIVVAGDVLDAEDIAQRTIRQAIERMAKHDQLVWHLLPGNHDPARRGGVWDRIAAMGLPDGIRPRTTTTVHEIAEGVHLLTAPLLARSASEDPTSAFERLPTPEGSIRIGLAHGSIKSFSGAGRAGEATSSGLAASTGQRRESAGGRLDTIDPKRAATAGLAYLALGDWHGMTRIDPRTWYSGTPEPDGFLDNQPGYALAVILDGAAAPVVTPVATASFVWRAERLAVESLADLEQAATRLMSLVEQPSRQLLLRLAVEGVLGLAERAAAEHWRERLAARVRHLEVDLEGLTTRAEIDDAALFAADDGLAEVARRLMVRAQSEEPIERGTAQRALVQLIGFARAAEREEAA